MFADSKPNPVDLDLVGLGKDPEIITNTCSGASNSGTHFECCFFL